jgi:ribose 5-phosphate isomerase B
MRIALGADHAGVGLKEDVRRLLDQRHIPFHDFGTRSVESVDYPDIAEALARAVAAGEYERGILICGTGIGMAIVANKVPGIRAAPISDPATARLAREHNDANVLTLGARTTPVPLALEIVGAFLDTPFEGGRHRRRLDKIAALEQGTGADTTPAA